MSPRPCHLLKRSLLFTNKFPQDYVILVAFTSQQFIQSRPLELVSTSPLRPHCWWASFWGYIQQFLSYPVFSFGPNDYSSLNPYLFLGFYFPEGSCDVYWEVFLLFSVIFYRCVLSNASGMTALCRWCWALILNSEAHFLIPWCSSLPDMSTVPTGTRDWSSHVLWKGTPSKFWFLCWPNFLPVLMSLFLFTFIQFLLIYLYHDSWDNVHIFIPTTIALVQISLAYNLDYPIAASQVSLRQCLQHSRLHNTRWKPLKQNSVCAVMTLKLKFQQGTKPQQIFKGRKIRESASQLWNFPPIREILMSEETEVERWFLRMILLERAVLWVPLSCKG